MDDETEPTPSPYDRPRAEAQLSKTPSWVMLGFVLGALFVYALMRHRGPDTPASVAVRIVEAPKSVAPREPGALTTVEAVFDVWGEHAVWSNNVTEVALWNKQDRAFSDYYEVRRIGGKYYFRSIPELTRRIIRRGKELPDSPLQFTETEEQYRDWLEHGRSERRPENESLRTTPGGNPGPERPRERPAK